jgi:GNAT superfamily N-acetyltransferase
MIEIVEQDYENVTNFTDDVIDRFAEACGQPFGWDQVAFEAFDNGERVGAIVGHRLYDWLYVEYIVVTESSRGEGVGSMLLERAEKPVNETEFTSKKDLKDNDHAVSISPFNMSCKMSPNNALHVQSRVSAFGRKQSVA